MDDAAAKKAAQSKTKLLLIPVLGIVFLYVLWSPSEPPAAPAVSLRPPSGPTVPSPGNAPVAKGAANAPGTSVKWPTTPLSEVLAKNPFQMPEKLRALATPVAPEPVAPVEPQVTTAERDAELAAALRAAAQTHRLTGLVQTSKGIGAIVGDTVVTVGDKIGDRLRVTSIRRDGVVLELIEPEPAPESQK